MPSSLDARSAAHRVLSAVARGAGSQDALMAALAAAPKADPRDRALLTELVYGTLRWQRRLDHALAAFAARGLPVADDATMAALRLAAYQLLFLPRIPDYAAVDAAVTAVKRARGQGLSRFANGMLRALARRRADPPALPEGDLPAALALRHSQPLWVVERLAAGRDPAALAARLTAENEPAPLVVRANREHGDAAALAAALAEEGAVAGPIADLPGALRVDEPGRMFRGAALAGARWLPQDAASQRVVALLEAQPGERVLDLCAGAGVKTTRLAEQVGPEGRVAAYDLAPARIDQLRDLVARWGVADRVRAAQADATGPLPDADGVAWDRVLLDAPCTSLGLLRRRPEVRWRRTADDVAGRAALQQRLLAAAGARVRPGGRLVYAVCTFTEEEGAAQVRRFLRENEAFTLVRPVPDNPAAPYLDAEGFLRTDPTRDGQDAFFAAALQRRG
jgi:16S rRNA (cytosine967-C5)-methyltransferase